MLVSAIQNQVTNSTQGLQKKKMSYSLGAKNNLAYDSVSFKSKAEVGTVVGSILGAGAAIGVMILTGPVLLMGAAAMLTELAITGAGYAAGSKLDEKDEQKKGNKGS